ncbi:8-oxo-dGTP pyrophosphatase MutT (NUDIX family) [Paenibacillus shirakamiensis]|uniref:8-oxo-dGTP pyrophosphatase MutT (NUDIX family) n=1 Tax=Paenibacillus shirakamiensis TaxID=1265935 RepID=A0ABS4JGJ3_9BACL|nr:NUDIX domain-containing protein [Paenibacillus shirakamiensis]MBP2000832.1 8-oxo-dGTP pyrophosphatase MutT (NUDIX family) [Paenibacillus shirakamiensis]
MFIINVEAAVCKDDQWLMITRSSKEEHAGGTISLVGGKVDVEGNTLEIIERTVKRELYEEVGIEVKEGIHFVYSSSFVTDEGYNVINMVFLCEYDKGTAYSKAPDEVDAVHWMTSSEIMSHPEAPLWTKESIRRAAHKVLRADVQN